VAALQRQGVAHWLTRGRIVEWSLVAVVVTVVVVVFMQRMREVQAQGEYAAVRTTLGALRTALVIDHLQRSLSATGVTSATAATQQSNPFELLERRPANYAGVGQWGQTRGVRPGSWVYDPACACIGYMPLNDGWLDTPTGEPMAWYQLSGAPGPLQLKAMGRYLWQEMVLD